MMLLLYWSMMTPSNGDNMDLFWDIFAITLLTSPLWFTAIVFYAYWPRKGDYDEE